jgi:DNA-directed RNA polymerase specialized sigma24 family protein
VNNAEVRLALTDPLRKKLVGYLRWRCGPLADVEEAVQEAMVSLCWAEDLCLDDHDCMDDDPVRSEFRDGRDLFRHLYHRAKAIVWNSTRQGYRRREVTTDPDLIPDGTPSESGAFESASRLREVWARMTPGERELTRLRFVRELEIDDVARTLGKSPSAVRTAIHRMRLRLNGGEIPERPKRRKPVRRGRRTSDEQPVRCVLPRPAREAVASSPQVPPNIADIFRR